ncbi:PTS sugar transporter subunit IIA [Pectinatus haikarae]|uniref:Mannitol-specific phosphotransferase enzyme IIA component n=1 Tax=Pectinatus haikarae TaxID=349096 RepID=A0ABT9Y633_9FIRM|nr:PTS sugar transporter subunit IIA [Pectinatus haikarae]MDQ0202980.1 mannitol/fructose-specific phosphotransferase system IIA component [Pectinatus haikarae]
MADKEKSAVNISTFMGIESVDIMAAVAKAGNYLAAGGFVEQEYVASMIRREKLRSTYIGRGIAISHGMPGSEIFIQKTGICVLQFPKGLQYGGGMVYLLIGLAINPEEDDVFFSKLSDILEDKVLLNKLFVTEDKKFFHDVFNQN